ARRDFFDRGLAWRGFVSSASGLVDSDSGLVNSGTGFSVEPFQRTFECGQLGAQLQHQLGTLEGAQDAVTEHAWVERHEAAKMLSAQTFRSFTENEKLVFGRKVWLVAELFSARDYPMQHLPRSDLQG